MKLLVTLVGMLLVFSGSFAQEKYVLLVSFDGFRGDYAEKYQLPTFLEMAANGSSAMMRPSYPSKTFPNHYALVTGLYPGHHLLVDNTFYDPELELTYRISDRDIVENPDFYGGWPIWQWAQHNGLKAASYFWVGSETKIKGELPNRWKKYDHDFPNEARIDSVFSWFNAPVEQRPNVVTLYFAFVDDAGHEWGPDDQRTEKALLYADSVLSSIRQGIAETGLPIDLIVVSDHGMYRMEKNSYNYIDLTSYVELPKNALRITNSGTHMHIYLNDTAFGEKFYTSLKGASSNFSIYRREEIPEHWHYRDSPRVGDFLLVAEPGSSFSRKKAENDWGVHGYDPYTTPEMNAIFYAEGPSIRQGVKLPEFQNVDVFTFICALLGIETPETDGDLTILGKALKSRN